MRHIALLSVLCISVSASALAAPQDLKARLAAARVEAERGDAGAALIAPPVPAQAKAVSNPAAVVPSIAVQAPQPVTDLDLLPKPGATIPLASSNVISPTPEKTPTALPAIPPVTAADKQALAKAPAKVTAAAPVTPTIAPVIKPAASAADIAWNEPQSAKPAKTVAPVAAVTAPVAASGTVKTESIIPTAKLQPVVLPSVITPLQPVKANAVKSVPVQTAPAIVATKEIVKAEPVAKPAEIKQPDMIIAKTADTKAPEQPAQAKPVQAKVVEAKVVEAKPVQQAKAEPQPEFLPMPQAMPAMQPKMIDATKNISMTREAVPAVPVIPATAKRVIPQIPASIPTGAWSTRMVGTLDSKDKDAAFCLMENKFDNRASLMIGQRADGYSTIGINYGVDMLDTGRNYSTLVLIDDSFEENFNGYAESGGMLIIQLGKKPSFFAMLANAQHLRIMLPGVASNFAIQGVNTALQEFATCLQSLGGELATGPATAPLAKGQNMPVVSTENVQSNDLTPPNATADLPPALPKASAKASGWSGYVAAILNSAGIRPKNVQQNAGVTEWTDTSGMHGQVWQVPGTDILEAAMTQLDEAEKECGGEFTNQIGTPENVNGQTIQMMESKCASAQGVSVSTWLVQQDPSGITAWEMRAPQAQNASTFDARQKVLTAINSQPRS